MKSGWKVFWITCSIMGSIGFACCIIALLLGVTTRGIVDYFPNGIGLVRYSHNDSIEREAYTEGGSDIAETYAGDSITDLSVQLAAGTLQIMESDTDEVRLEATKIDSRLRLRYYVEDGELVVETKKNITGVLSVPHQGTIYLFLPKGLVMEEVDIKVGAGALYMDDIQANNLSVDIGAGEAVIDQFQASETDFQCGTGRIVANGEPGAQMDVKCGIGEISLSVSGTRADYSYELQCGIGNIHVGDESYSGLGRTKEIYNNTGKVIDINCGIGNVTVDFNY